MLSFPLFAVLAGSSASQAQLDLSVSTLVPGRPAVFRVEGGLPQQTVTVLRSTAGVGPGPCRGDLCLDILQPAPTLTLVVDEFGVAEGTVTLPPDAPVGLNVAFQAAIAAGDGDKSEVVTTIIADDTPEAHCGAITGTDFWPEGLHLVTCDVTVGSGGSLVILDGATVLFAPGTSLRVGDGSAGSLWIDGDNAGVYLTSASPDPAPGDWEGVYLGSGADGAVLEGATLRWAGGLGPALTINRADSTLLDVVIEASGSDGIAITSARVGVDGVDVSGSAGDGLRCADATCLDHTYGNRFVGNAGHGVSVPFSLVGALDPWSSTYAGNGIGGVEVSGGAITSDATWHGLDGSYVVTGDIAVGSASGPVWTLADGAVLRFHPGMGVEVAKFAEGELVIDGHTDGVVLTGLTPAPGSWSGVLLDYRATSASSILGLTLAYAGDNGSGGLNVDTSDELRIHRSTFRDNLGSGVKVAKGDLVVTDSVFADNTLHGLELAPHYTASLRAPFTGNVFTGNGSYPARLNPEDLGRVDASSTFVGNTLDYLAVNLGVVNSDTRVPALGVPYAFLGEVDVAGGALPTLTFADNAVAEFAFGVSLRVGSALESGDLVIEGDLSDGVGVTFRSHLGVGPGSGGKLRFEGSATESRVEGLVFEDGDGILIRESKVIVTDSVIRSQADDAIAVTEDGILWIADSVIEGAERRGLNTTQADGLLSSGLTIRGCGGAPASVEAPLVEGLDGTFTGNGLDVIEVTGQVINRSTTWPDLGVPYQMMTFLQLQNGLDDNVLTIEASEVQLQQQAGFSVGRNGVGDLVAPGVLFRSWRQPGQPGDWQTFWFGPNTQVSSLEGAVIAQGGADRGNVTCERCRLDLDQATIVWSAGYGIYLVGQPGQLPHDGIVFANNADGDVHF